MELQTNTIKGSMVGHDLVSGGVIPRQEESECCTRHLKRGVQVKLSAYNRFSICYPCQEELTEQERVRQMLEDKDPVDVLKPYKRRRR